jgi:hypothetical protein
VENDFYSSYVCIYHWLKIMEILHYGLRMILVLNRDYFSSQQLALEALKLLHFILFI